MNVHSFPPGSYLLTPSAEFRAVLDVNIGEYVIEKTPVNFLSLDPRSVYLFQTFTVSSNIEQADFFNSRINPLKIDFIYKQEQNGARNFPEKLEVNAVEQPYPMSNIFYTLNGSNSNRDYLQIIPEGRFRQQVGMIDVEEIVFNISAVCMRSGNQKFVNDTKKEQGQ